MPVEQTSTHVTISHPGTGASVSIAHLGASVFSWKTGKDEKSERLFKSSVSPLEGPAAIRGGIPVVWPVFGPPPKEAPFDKLKQHGFARIEKWKFEGLDKDDDQEISARFTLAPNESIKSVYPHEFHLTYYVTLHPTSESLSTFLKVSNPSTASSKLKFQTLFHTYFRLPEGVLPKDINVQGFQGKKYVDKVDGSKEKDEGRSEVKIEGETDRVYYKTPDTLKLSFGPSNGGVKIEKKNLKDTVYWNPDAAKSDGMKDMEPEGWKRFVCVEPGQIEPFVELEVGGEWIGGQRLVVEN